MSEGRPDGLPESKYQEYLGIAQGLSNPDYDYLINCVIVREREDVSVIKGPYLTTAWSQLPPYNDNVPSEALLGCGAVATGQIIAYHKYPTNKGWNWNNIVVESTQPYVASFLYDVALGINTVFGPTASSTSSSTTSDTRDYFIELGYNAQMVAHSDSKVIESISASRPVFMSGKNPVTTICHAWVCDGTNICHSYYTYKLYILSVTEPLQYEVAGAPYNDSSSYTFYYMNWGDGVQSTMVGSNLTSQNNYTTNRQDIVNIYPK